MELVEVRLAGHASHFTLIRPSAAWLAIPVGNGNTKLYLRYPIEPAFPPQRLQPDTPTDDLLLALFRWRFSDEIGSVLETTASTEACADAFNLVRFSAKGEKGESFPLALCASDVNGVTPAYDANDLVVGSNIFMRYVCMETNGYLIPVREPVDEVLRRCGWEYPTVAIGRSDVVATPRRIITPGLQQ